MTRSTSDASSDARSGARYRSSADSSYAGAEKRAIERVARVFTESPLVATIALLVGATLLIAGAARVIHMLEGAEGVVAAAALLGAIGVGLRFACGLFLAVLAAVRLVRSSEGDRELMRTALIGALGLGLLGGWSGLVACLVLGGVAAVLVWKERSSTARGRELDDDGSSATSAVKPSSGVAD